MRLLQLCPRFPWPLTDGGRIGMFNITKHLAERGHRIDMIVFAEDDTTPEHVRDLERYCSVRLVRDNTRTDIRNFMRSVVRREPVYITRHRSGAFIGAMHEALATTTYDAVLGDHSAMFPYLIDARRIAGIPVVMRLHNVESVIWHRYARDERNPWKRMLAAWQARRLEQYEAAGAARVDANFAITLVDEARMHRLSPLARVITAPPGVDLDQWSPLQRNPSSRIAITATTYSWIHNVNAVNWFIDSVLPAVQAQIPGFAFHLLGRCPPASLQRRAGAAVNILGFVEDIKPYIAEAGVFVVPLQVGSGIRIKILEAMAMGIPVVTTSVGCEGIDGVPGVHYLVADTPGEFAAAVVDVLSDPVRSSALSREARAFVCAHFKWETTAAIIEGEIAARIAAAALVGGGHD